ncbi:hypothetical protein BDF21DRAFT_463864 [Thamnidium elegans]|uniref:Uncharacterized protein n=1 Tax=Thamnidium elegans TaxID=101142 RepID=A0A8H7W254_9FUNG|nr:hypothetical protein INT48_009164 [Thamnidium elegans]KAI8077424.1 hypothetical protein BDF21DRAFT_463864 [Thamnidium elegans]
MRPDATISTLVQHEFGYPLGFGETKVGKVSTTKRLVNLDIFRLDVTYCFYTMTEIASLDFASSLFTLHTFASRKNLDLLAAVSNFFGSNCAQDVPNAAAVTTPQEGLEYHIVISEYMSVMAKASKGTLGQPS